jgi:hypothetical protein
MINRKSSYETALKKLGIVNTNIDEPVYFQIHDKMFKLVKGNTNKPSELIQNECENLIVLNNPDRSSHVLLFDIYRCVAHAFDNTENTQPKTWLRNAGIMIKNENIIREMICDQYAIEKLKYGIPTVDQLIHDIDIQTIRLMYPGFTISVLERIRVEMNTEIEYRRLYIQHLISKRTGVSLTNKTFDKPGKDIDPKRLRMLKKSIAEYADDIIGIEHDFDAPIIYYVCKKLNIHIRKTDSFDIAMKQIIAKEEWKKKDAKIKKFIDDWVIDNYNEYKRMVSEKERTPKRELISKVLFDIICNDAKPNTETVMNVKKLMEPKINNSMKTQGLLTWKERQLMKENGLL